jgi:hypothetical protein
MLHPYLLIKSWYLQHKAFSVIEIHIKLRFATLNQKIQSLVIGAI